MAHTPINRPQIQEAENRVQPTLRTAKGFIRMSKPTRRLLYYQNSTLFAVLHSGETLPLPEIIEGQAKGWIKKYGSNYITAEIKQHKPQHTKGRKPRYYYVHDPKKRPLIAAKRFTRL